MKKLWLKQTILTLGLTLCFAAVASAQTTGDARCTDSTVGKYWVPVTQDGGYCAPSESERVQQIQEINQVKQLAAQPSASVATAPWQSGKPVPPAVTPPTGDPQCANSTLGEYWAPTPYGGYCTNSQTEKARQQKLTLEINARDDRCHTNISFAVAEGGNVFPSMPSFVAKWVSNKKHLAKHQGMCFSQTPSASAENYLIVFSTSASSFAGLYPTVRRNISTSSVSGNGTAIDNYGDMWSYTYNGTVTTTTTTTENVPYMDTSRTLYASAYNQYGAGVSNRSATLTTRQGGDPYNTLGYNLGAALVSIHLKERLLEATLKEIH